MIGAWLLLVAGYMVLVLLFASYGAVLWLKEWKRLPRVPEKTRKAKRNRRKPAGALLASKPSKRAAEKGQRRPMKARR